MLNDYLSFESKICVICKNNKIYVGFCPGYDQVPNLIIRDCYEIAGQNLSENMNIIILRADEV